MDAFEQIVGQLLETEKFWVRHSVKINLTPSEKKSIGKSTTPRPEIDIVAYDAVSNKLYLIEVKSFLDSMGVIYDQVVVQQGQQAGRYKLLTSKNYRNILTQRLLSDWINDHHVPSNVNVTYGLVAGKVYSTKKYPNREADLETYFQSNGWLFWGPKKIKAMCQNLAHTKYENNTVTIASKILLR